MAIDLQSMHSGWHGFSWGRTEEGALALRMRSAVAALRWREDSSAKGGGLLRPPSSLASEAEEPGGLMGTAPSLNSTILLAGAFLPLLLHNSIRYAQRQHNSEAKEPSGLAGTAPKLHYPPGWRLSPSAPAPLGQQIQHLQVEEPDCFMGTAPRLNSPILLAGAFLPLLLHPSDNMSSASHSLMPDTF